MGNLISLLNDIQNFLDETNNLEVLSKTELEIHLQKGLKFLSIKPTITFDSNHPLAKMEYELALARLQTLLEETQIRNQEIMEMLKMESQSSDSITLFSSEKVEYISKSNDFFFKCCKRSGKCTGSMNICPKCYHNFCSYHLNHSHDQEYQERKVIDYKGRDMELHSNF